MNERNWFAYLTCLNVLRIVARIDSLILVEFADLQMVTDSDTYYYALFHRASMVKPHKCNPFLCLHRKPIFMLPLIILVHAQGHMISWIQRMQTWKKLCFHVTSYKRFSQMKYSAYVPPTPLTHLNIALFSTKISEQVFGNLNVFDKRPSSNTKCWMI